MGTGVGVGGRLGLTCFEGNLRPSSSDKLDVAEMQYPSQQPQNLPNFLLAELHDFHCRLEENKNCVCDEVKVVGMLLKTRTNKQHDA